MKTLIIALSFLVISTQASAAQLVAKLVTGGVQELKKSIEIKMQDGSDSQWVIQEWNQCPSYPCNPKDYMTETKVTPIVIEDSRAGDGVLILKLNDKMTVRNEPAGLLPPGVEHHEFTLELNEGGKILKIPLVMLSYISSKE